MTTVILGLNLSPWLASPEPTFVPGEQLTELVARELRASLSSGSANPTEIAERYAIDLAPMLEVFVLDEQGRDLLGRTVPGDVFRAIVGEELTSWLPDDWSRATVITEDLQGYTVASYEGVYVIGRAMADPVMRIVMLVLAIVISALVSLLLAHFIVQPVTRLREAGRLVASGDLSVRVLPALGKRQDALAELARDFDFMTERVAGSLAAQQQLMRDVSHELRSPLARLQALISIEGQQESSNNSRFLGRLENELSRLDELIGDILALSRLQMQERITRTRTDIVDLVRTIVDDVSIETDAANKAVRIEAPESCILDVDHWLVHSAIENIVRNAVRHTATATCVVISVLELDEYVDVAVSDDGPGVPEASLEAIFLPFYRIQDGGPSPTGSGGIGLAIASRAATLHGGSVTAHNRDTGGLCVVFRLPRLLAD
ncbi:MAG: ATP-binding protein [Pseudomonadota bacterium]